MKAASVLRLLPLAAILLVCGCGSNNKGKIEGTKWSSTASAIKGKSLPAGALRLDFGSDGHLVYSAGFIRMTGTYTLGTGDYVTMHLDQPLQGRKDHTERMVIQGDQLTMTDSDGTQIMFQKTP